MSQAKKQARLIKEYLLSDRCDDLSIIMTDGMKPNNIWNLGYDHNRTYIAVLNMSPCVENQTREIFHQISKSSKFLHYCATLHDTKHNRTAKVNNPEMVNISFLSKGIVSNVILLFLS